MLAREETFLKINRATYNEQRALKKEGGELTVAFPGLWGDGIIACSDAASPDDSVVARGHVNAVAVRPPQIRIYSHSLHKDVTAVQEVQMERG